MAWASWSYAGDLDWKKRLIRFWLAARLRFAVQMRQCRYSLTTTLERGLIIGLPYAAILAATVPIWGVNWYFDSENWAAGMYNSWAEHRTVVWREAMVRAVTEGRADRT